MGLFDFIKKKIPDIEQTLKDNNIINNVTNKKAEVNTSQEYYFTQTQEKLKKRYIAFDIETTGLSPIEDRIIELGAVLFENGEIIKSFSSLVNTDKINSTEAMKVNNISNEMLQNAPTEREIYPKFLEFLGEAFSGEILMCAHNANFDINFLRNTLERLGYSGKIKFVDTLSISRNLVYGLENYKQATLEEFFNISNKESHRAVTDAEACGKILWQLLHYENKVEDTPEKDIIKYELDDYEKILFAYIVNLINENGLDTDYLGAKKTSNGYISVTCLYHFLKYRFTKNGKYLIVRKKDGKNCNLQLEPCNTAEGGEEYIRVYFDSLNQICELNDYIIKEFISSYKSMKGYINGQSRKEKIVLNELQSQNTITIQEAKECVAKELEINSLENHCNGMKIKYEKELKKEELRKEKEIIKKQKELEKELKKNQPKEPIAGRGIIQMDDNGNIIKKYISISEAVRETGVNSKSIRDAAKGVQKHAGGFVWKYEDEGE